MALGDRLRMHGSERTDPTTRRTVRRLTDCAGNDQLLYFTSNSLTADDEHLVFLSDRDGGHPNLFCLHRKTNHAVQLTSNQSGYLESYVYFDGNREGLAKASMSLHASSGDLYYLQGRTDRVTEVRRVNVHTLDTAVLAELPSDHVTAFTHVSEDNQWLCVPTIHESAFAEAARDRQGITPRVDRLGLRSAMRFIRTDGSGKDIRWHDPGWVTHVQFHPRNADCLLYNHEWCPDSGVRRMWLYRDGKVVRLRPPGTNADGSLRGATDWTCHEMWQRDGRAVIYHGTRGPIPYLGQVSPSGTDHIELAFPEGWVRYGHFTVSSDPTLLVTDGYVEVPEAKRSAHRQGQWISLVRADWARGSLSWLPLCEHGSSWTSQDAHPHPIFAHGDREVLFTSDVDGKRAIYAVEVNAAQTGI